MTTSLSVMQMIVGVHVLMQDYFNGISGTILSFSVVWAGSFVIIMLSKSKQTSRRKIRKFKLD